MFATGDLQDATVRYKTLKLHLNSKKIARRTATVAARPCPCLVLGSMYNIAEDVAR